MRDAPRYTAPATGSDSPRETELTPEEEPDTSGTLVLVMIILMFIAGGWITMYLLLLSR
ncbi:MAG TPA: cytochrome c oxidase subunit 2A [Thermodesulfobacteriota bacterium]